MPKKPKVIICVIDYPSHEGICNETDGEKIKRIDDIDYDNIVNKVMSDRANDRIPLSSMDKSVCFAPREWEKVQNYIDEMHDYIRRECR